MKGTAKMYDIVDIPDNSTADDVERLIDEMLISVKEDFDTVVAQLQLGLAQDDIVRGTPIFEKTFHVIYHALMFDGVTVVNDKIFTAETGYAVALDYVQIRFHKDAINDMAQMIYDLGLSNYGIWYNREDGYWYLDTQVLIIEDFSHALETAINANQLSIWDWANSKAIDVREHCGDAYE